MSANDAAMKDNVKRIVETITSVEQLYDVNSMQRLGLFLWPIMRMNIVLGMPSAKNRPKFEVDYDLYSDWELRIHNEPCEHVLTLKEPPRQADVVLISWPEDNTEVLGGKHYNKHIDTFYEMCAKEGLSCLKLEPYNDSCASIGERRYPADLLTLDALPRPRTTGPAPFDPTVFDGVKQALADQAPQVRVDFDRVMRESYAVCYLRDRFLPLLQRIKPRVVILTRIFNFVAKALISACRSLGIATMDFLHSSNIQYDYKYSYWTKLPPQGYDTLPDVFWCWSESSAAHLSCFRDAPETPHLPIVGGNPWVDRWTSGDLSELSDEGRSFLQTLEGFDRTILVSLQHIKDYMPDVLRAAVMASPPSWKWLFRLHPYQRGYMPEVLESLKDLPEHSFEIDLSTSLPLCALLPRCSHHVTCASSVAREAQVFSVPTTVIHYFGREIFTEEIERGEYGYADEPRALLERIRTVTTPRGTGQNGNLGMYRTRAGLRDIFPVLGVRQARTGS